jgi:GGDEF domain-containing protein
VKGVIRVMAEHNEAVKADYRLRTSELGRALRIMVETIGDVSTSSQAAVHQLSVIEKNLEEATAGLDAARLRSKLEVCVKMIREHSQILRTQTENQVNQLKSFVASTAPGLSSMVEFEAPLDEVTGLPTRSFAENLINERMARGSDCLVGVVALDRYHSLLGSFGPDVMDDLVKTVAGDLAERLPDGTTLCRWSPNSFIAISEIVSSFAETSQQWRKVRGLKLEKQIETKAKTAFVLLNTALMVEHLRPVSSKRAFIQGVEKFAQQHGGAPTGK